MSIKLEWKILGEEVRDFNLANAKTNFGMKLAHHNSGVESPKIDSTTKLFEISLVGNQDRSNLECTKGDSTIESLVIDFVKDVEVIMTRCYFIEPIKLTSKGEKKFIHTKMVFAIDTEIKHLNFNI
jgi:hypothetical protein